MNVFRYNKLNLKVVLEIEKRLAQGGLHKKFAMQDCMYAD